MQVKSAKFNGNITPKTNFPSSLAVQLRVRYISVETERMIQQSASRLLCGACYYKFGPCERDS